MQTTLELFEQTDWSGTELGPVESWPRSLRSYVSMVLGMPWPAIVFWGESQIQIYNDSYAVIMGPRHPRYFGARYRDCWPDTYPTIYPWMRKVLDRGEAVEVQRTHIPLTRFGFDEEAYFTFIFSPLRDDEGRIAGILQPVFEVTAEVLSTRRAELIRSLSAVGRAADPFAELAAAIGTCPDDIPFALVWLRDKEGSLALAARVRHDSIPDAAMVRLESASAQVAASGEPLLIDDLATSAASASGAAPAAHRALVLPIEDGAGATARGAAAFGVSARLHFDGRYRQFLEQATHQVAASLGQAAALQELERRRNYLNELFLQAPAGIAILAGSDHVFELVNPVYRSMIGEREVLGRPIREALPELTGQPFIGILDEAYRTGTPYVGREMSAWLHFDASERRKVVFTFLYQPLRDASRAVTGMLIMCYDVTAQVQERERAEALAVELREEHKRKDEFLAMLAHELRNPLAPISSAAQLLRRGGLDIERQQWASQVIARQVTHMASLVDDLLDVSRVTRGLVEIERAPVDLKSVVAEAAEQVRPLLEARRHRLAIDLPDGAADVVGDRKRLVQVLTNLLNNAAKFTPEDGAVAVAVSLEARQVRVDVRDDGIGIPPELLPRVFDLFVQAERSNDRAQGGLGIGLALVRTLVELHGGTVSAASGGLGAGSEFAVLLPRGRGLAIPGDASDPAEQAPATVARRVLVVDDNVDAADALGFQLESIGHRVRIEHDGVAALASARLDPPEVCLLDIGLPGMDGYALARELRLLPGTAGALLIAISGYAQAADRQKAMAAGFDRYVVKPLDPEQLFRLLRE